MLSSPEDFLFQVSFAHVCVHEYLTYQKSAFINILLLLKLREKQKK